MKVLLLAAGRSRRVKPIEDKNFLRFCGKFLLEHQLDALHAAGFTDIVVMGGAHNLERFKAFAADFLKHHEGVRLTIEEQVDLEAGMAGALLSAAPHWKNNEPLFLVSSNDVVDAEAYRLIFDAGQNPLHSSYLLGKRVSQYFPGGYLKVNGSWAIEGIVEKPGAGNEPSDLVNLVLHVHRDPQRLFEMLKTIQSSRDDHYEVALDTLIREGVKMQAVPYSGYWQPIKFPWHVLEVARHFFENTPKHIAPTAQVDETANIQGDVVVEEGCRIFAGATVVGPVYLGKNTVVATNALVRDAYTGDDCVIGFSTEVARSVLGDNVWTHSNYIGDSVIGNDVSFGAGTVTGNLRFDEENIRVTIDNEKVDSGLTKLGLITGDHIRVGVNTSFMPGVKVGSHSCVGAGLIVDKNIPEKSFVSGESTLKIVPNRTPEFPSRDSQKISS